MRTFIFVLSLFSALSADEDQAVKTCNDGLGECVPFYLCINGTINTDGEGVLDIRFDPEKECVQYIEECCPIDNVSSEKPKVPNKEITADTCGIRNKEGVVVRVSGDSDGETQYGEFPWMVGILEQQNENGTLYPKYTCGGSLISENVVLTAAHCVEDKNPVSLTVRVGEWDTQTTDEFFLHTDHYVKAVIVHDKYGGRKNLHNDIALLFLQDNVEFVENVYPVCLPPENHNFDTKRCVTTGWGKNTFGKEGEYQVILKKVDLPVVPFAKCQNDLRKTRLGRRFRLHESFMCAGGEEGKDACKGDGGSPLVCPIEGSQDQYYQAGIVAWGIGCGDKDVPGVYVNVPSFRKWIDAEILSYNLFNN